MIKHEFNSATTFCSVLTWRECSKEECWTPRMIPPNQFWRFQLGVLFCHNVCIFCSCAPCVMTMFGFCSCGSDLGLDSLSLFVLPFPSLLGACQGLINGLLIMLSTWWKVKLYPEKKKGYFLVEKCTQQSKADTKLRFTIK